MNEDECVEVKLKKENTAEVFAKPMIPGLDIWAEENKPYDKNLAPLSVSALKTLQYGDTTISSVTTDHPDWAPGTCPNLFKYEGNLRLKVSSLTQPVITYFN